jgi:hypothetical protein
MPPTSPAAASNPLAGKVLSAVLGGAGAAAVFYALHTFRQTQEALLVIAAGLLAVALLLVLYRVLLGWWRKRKAAPMTRSILANSSAAPHGISDPARRAKLDEMRKSFEAGVAKFRAAGKDLYTLPWVVLVGEPGGGKTEAIRHSQVGFPHGLQDPMQGAGGTVNMNWWFTNHAIILDTAGRLMFEEVAPGSTNEWNEFLSLLRQNRPNCPINGMILVIPADTLIKDSTEAIERKAGKIAQQLDVIQRTLEVRFPVFVVISKCDLISGFREFFETVDDPQLQGQIMGWSNPMSLDQPFNPEMVDEHLKTVRHRLAQRRYGLLLDPVHTEDPGARRIDQVDALYTFPDALARVGPRLRRYLEMIFVAGEWSPKPLFLRGIYFTSSMREGEALDAELAEVLKVPVDSLQGEGRAWERNKTFFLREPFLKKIFVEKGLVTRASRPNRLHRARKVAVLGFGFLAVLVLAGLTYQGNRDFTQSLGGESGFWRDVRANHGKWAVIESGRYNNEAGLPGLTLNELFARSAEHTRPIKVPPVFKAAQVAANDLTPEMRKDGYRAVFEKTVLGPLLVAAREKLSRPSAAATWTPETTAALGELIRAEAASLAPADLQALPLELDPLFKAALRDRDEFTRYQEMKSKGDLARSAERIYSPPPKTDWARTFALACPAGSADKVLNAIGVFRSAWDAKRAEAAPSARVDDLDEALQRYKTQRASLRTAAEKAGQIKSSEDYNAVRAAIAASLKELESVRGEIVNLTGAVRKDVPADKSLHAFYTDRIKRLRDTSAGEFKALRDACGEHHRLLAALNDAPTFALGAGEPEKLQRLDGDLTPLDTQRFPDVPRYAAVEEVYRRAVAEMDKATEPPPAGGADPRAGSGAEESAGDQKALQALLGSDKDADAAFESWKLASRAAASYRSKVAVEALIARYQRGIAPLVRDQASARPRKFPAGILFTDIAAPPAISPDFDPAEARKVLGSLQAVGKLLEADPTPGAAVVRPLDVNTLRESFAKAQQAVVEYMGQYTDYWGKKVPSLAALDPNRLGSWDSFFKDHGNLNHRSVISGQQQLLQEIVSALEVANFLPSDDNVARAAAARRAALAQIAAVLGDGTFQKECDEVLRGWLRSQGNAASLKEQILDKNPIDFSRDFIFQSVERTDFVGQYWTDLTVSLLRLLAAKTAQLNTANFEQHVRPYGQFPLRLHARDELSPEQVDEARTKVLQFLGGRWPDEPSPAREGSVIRDGNVAGVPKAAEQHLRQLRSGLGDAKRYVALRQVFEALDPRNPATCTVKIMDFARRNELVQDLAYKGQHAEGPFRDIGMQQGTGTGTYTTYDSKANADFVLGRFKSRSKGPIVLTLGQTAVDITKQRKVKLSFAEPWAAMRMLDGPNVKYAKPRQPVRTEGGVQQAWDVMLEVQDRNQRSAVWLVVTIDRVLPDPADWEKPLQ